MPAALDIPWEAVRTLAVAVGIREAARQIGVSEDAVRQRSCREGWLRDLPRSTPLPPTVLQRVTNVTEPGKAMADTMRNLGESTRFGLAKGLAAGADHVSTLNGEEVVFQAAQVATLAKAAAVVHDWARTTNVNVLSDVLTGQLPSMDDDVIDV